MIYLKYSDALRIIDLHLPGIAVRDVGLLQSALSRPQSEYGGVAVYPDLESKGAASVQSIVGNHPLIDGNKRLGLICLIIFLSLNGYRLEATNDEAYDFIIAIASSDMREFDDIVEWIRTRLSRVIS